MALYLVAVSAVHAVRPFRVTDEMRPTNALCEVRVNSSPTGRNAWHPAGVDACGLPKKLTARGFLGVAAGLCPLQSGGP
jgi:hypothetical protein